MRTRAEASVAGVFANTKFPRNKEEILSVAKESKNKARYPESLIQVLDRISERDYDSLQDIEREIAKVQQHYGGKGKERAPI